MADSEAFGGAERATYLSKGICSQSSADSEAFGPGSQHKVLRRNITYIIEIRFHELLEHCHHPHAGTVGGV